MVKKDCLVNLVSYQEGSVISRTLIKEEKGTITLFAFDKDQALSEHTVNFDAMVNVLDGEAEIIIDGKPFRLKTGDMIIMPANKPHAVKAVAQFKMLLVMIKK